MMQKQLPRDESELIVGIAAGYAPFVSINAAGKYEGFDIDVAHALADQMGKKLVLKDLGCMTSLFMALDQGKIDVIAWGLSITQERLEKVAMIHYQGAVTDSYPLIFWKEIPTGIATLDDLHGVTLCVEPASVQDMILNKYNKINKLSTEKVDDALLNIQYNKALAAFVEPAIAKKFKNKYQEIQILDVPLKHEDQAQGVGLVVKKNNSLLINQLEVAVTMLKSTGVIEQLEQKWDIPS
jgi:polar amino acid transport system substrate-binding protein